MLRSIRPEIELARFGHQLLLRQRGPGRRRALAQALPADAPADQVMAVLPRATRARLQVYLPSSAFLFWRVPWLDASLDEADTWELAASLLKQDFGQSTDAMAFCLTPPRFGQARLACGLPRATLATLAAAAPPGATLAGVHPLLSLAWPVLGRSARPLFYSEPGLAALCLHEADGPRLHTRRLHPQQGADACTAAALAALFGIAPPPHFALQPAGTWLALAATPVGDLPADAAETA